MTLSGVAAPAIPPTRSVVVYWGFFGGSDLNIDDARKMPVSYLAID
jgi:hypothetical protein